MASIFPARAGWVASTPVSTTPITTPLPVDCCQAAGAPIWARFHCWSKYLSLLAPAGDAEARCRARSPATATAGRGRGRGRERGSTSGLAEVGAADGQPVGVELGIGGRRQD